MTDSDDQADLVIELRILSGEMRDIEHPRGLYYTVNFWAALAAAMTINLGVMLVIGTTQRVSGHAYEGIAHWGGPTVWGSMFVITGGFTALCAWKFSSVLRWAILLQAIPYAAIALSFAAAAVRYPDANLTAAPIYAWIMIIHGFLSDYARKEY